MSRTGDWPLKVNALLCAGQQQSRGLCGLYTHALLAGECAGKKFHA